MSFVNLTLVQFLGLFAAISAGVLLLYLLDRSRQRKVVASLLFWRNAMTPVESRRWRIQQPWSLLLQLLGILLLLLAVAQLRLGGTAGQPRDHVLVLDTSAWMAAQWQGGTLMDEAAQRAREYIAALPATDRVMVMRANSVETPVTSFEENRDVIEEAIQTSRPGHGAASVERALAAAARGRRMRGAGAGEIVFIGSGHTAGRDVTAAIDNLRYIEVGGPIENVGLQRVGLRQVPESRNVWDVYVAVRNHGSLARSVDMSVQFASSPAAFEKLELAPQSEEEFTFPLRTRAAGVLEVRLFASDGFPDDDSVALEIPARDLLRMVVYSREPELIRPLVEASPMVEAEFRLPGDSDPPDADVVVFDRCEPSFAVTTDSIWIAPPASASPIPLTAGVRNAKVVSWSADHLIGSGLRTQDLLVDFTAILEPGPDDDVIAAAREGAVVVARDPAEAGAHRIVVLGFHPMRSAMRYELAAPLLFANIVRWVKPDVFRQWAINTGSVGTVSVPIEDESQRRSVRVTGADGAPLPFAMENDSVRFYSGRPGIVRVEAGEREIVYSLTLPANPDASWEPPETVLRGVPAKAARQAGPAELWPWLALAGLASLILEWLLFGRHRSAAARIPAAGSWGRKHAA